METGDRPPVPNAAECGTHVDIGVGVGMDYRLIAPVYARRLPRLVSRAMGDISRRDGLCRAELDSHAKQCCVSDVCALIIHHHSKQATVSGYDGAHSRTLDIVDAVVSYVDPSTGDRWMLVLNQSLLVPGLQHPLLCTNQLRMNDCRVNDEPKYLALNPTDYHHAIAVESPDGNEQVPELIIPLSLTGVFSYFEAAKPTLAEWTDSHEDWCVHLTYDSPEWEPMDLGLHESEEAMIDEQGHTVERDSGRWDQERISRVIASLSKDRVFDPPADTLAGALQSQVQVWSKSNVQ